MIRTRMSLDGAWDFVPDPQQQWREWVETFAKRPPWTFAHTYEGIAPWRDFLRSPWTPVERTPVAALMLRDMVAHLTREATHPAARRVEPVGTTSPGTPPEVGRGKRAG